jgi:hypothetical protein
VEISSVPLPVKGNNLLHILIVHTQALSSGEYMHYESLSLAHVH